VTILSEEISFPGCCARAASGHAAAPPLHATNGGNRMVRKIIIALAAVAFAGVAASTTADARIHKISTAVRACARYGVLHFEQKCLRTNMEFVQ